MNQTPTQKTGIEKLEKKAIMFDVLKGGCGKSALSLNLADRMDTRGHDVLYLDFDPNGHISFALGYDDVYNDSMHDYGYVTLDQKAYSKETLTPQDMIYETDFGFDFVPSYDDMESFSATLDTLSTDMRNGNRIAREEILAKRFLLPLYEDGEYDYFIMDGGGERSTIADNGFYAGKSAIVPLNPGDEALSAWKRTWQRIISRLQPIGFDVLAVVPNRLDKRLDHNNDNRILLERLNNSEKISPHLPEFATITDEQWEKIDDPDTNYDWLPGIRTRSAISNGISNGMPAAHFADSCDQLKHIDTLVEIIEKGGVQNA